MKAAVFVEPGRIVLEDKPIPDVGPLDALVRITTTTICGTHVHILKGEYPVAKGLTIGHEPVGVIEKLGSAVHGYAEGQRVIAGAITPSMWSNACQCGRCAQDGAGTRHEIHSGINDNFSFATLSEAEMAKRCREIASGVEAVVVICTNGRGPMVAATLEEQLGIPILDSVAVTLWGALWRQECRPLHLVVTDRSLRVEGLDMRF
nr:alcohol dehydrogenase catalytic domain-containing protein [Paracoccus saliphilus]